MASRRPAFSGSGGYPRGLGAGESTGNRAVRRWNVAPRFPTRDWPADGGTFQSSRESDERSMAPKLPMYHQQPSVKGSRWAEELERLLHAAFAKSELDGIGRKFIAARLRVSVRTINAWASPSHGTALTSARLVEILVRQDVLSSDARRELLGALASLAGFTVCDESEEDDKPLPVQVTEVAAAIGDVASRVRLSMSPRSPGGERMSSQEKTEIRRACDEAIAQLDQIRRAAR